MQKNFKKKVVFSERLFELLEFLLVIGVVATVMLTFDIGVFCGMSWLGKTDDDAMSFCVEETSGGPVSAKCSLME